jgi:hypothetical protein
MPLQKILFKPGVNRENTRYTTEGGWYDCDKIRFRQGNPETIGGWQRYSTNTFLGVCRSLWNWVTVAGANLIGVGTNLKFYIESGSAYNDITPIRASSTINNNPFVATNGSAIITVTDTAHGAITGDFVTFSSATGLGGNITATVLNAEYQITVLTANTYTFTASATANATDASGSPGGGASVVAAYQVNVGSVIQQPILGWGAGPWGGGGASGGWGYGTSTAIGALRVWNQSNFGDNLVFGPRGGALYYWDETTGLAIRGVLVSSLAGASDVPVIQNYIFVSDVSRFVFCFGCNDPFATSPNAQDPMLIRWSDQESVVDWTPSITNQAGSTRLSHGSEIIMAVQTRQEIVVFTDSAVYSLQYLGPPYVWSAQLLADNISIYSQNAAVLGSGVIYWMGVDKFYTYDGRVNTLNCDLLRYVFNDINYDQNQQVFAGTNEGFNEVWWFYCSADSEEVDRYVIYNYLEKVWYYGTMSRTAWLDSGLLNYPLAATYSTTAGTGLLLNHELGINDIATATTLPINAYISSAEFDIGDGHNFAFIWRVLPDLTFANSSISPANAPATVTMTLQGLANSGSGVTSTANQSVVKGSTYTITEEFTGQIFTRIRGRQMIFKIESNQVNTSWQLGAPRIDIRQDGRR